MFPETPNESAKDELIAALRAEIAALKAQTWSTADHMVWRDGASDRGMDANQITEACRWKQIPRYLIRDRDGVTKITAALMLGFIRLYCGPCHDLSLAWHLQCVGCDKKNL